MWTRRCGADSVGEPDIGLLRLVGFGPLALGDWRGFWSWDQAHYSLRVLSGLLWPSGLVHVFLIGGLSVPCVASRPGGHRRGSGLPVGSAELPVFLPAFPSQGKRKVAGRERIGAVKDQFGTWAAADRYRIKLCFITDNQAYIIHINIRTVESIIKGNAVPPMECRPLYGPQVTLRAARLRRP